MSQALVIKVGGALLTSPDAIRELYAVIAQLQQHKLVILVHGGGDTVQALLTQLNFNSEKIDGVRVTPQAHIPYVSGALAGTVNTALCGQALACQLKPIGLTLADGNTCEARVVSEHLGAVGEVRGKDPHLLTLLCQTGYLPIISSIAAAKDGAILNVNADQAAAAIAELMEAELVLLSDVPGVLDQNKSLLPELGESEIHTLIADSVIAGGMVVKVRSALETANTTGQSVYITSWQTPEKLLSVIHGQSVGTRILPSQQISQGV